MRKLIYAMNVTLDGYIAAPGVTHPVLVGGGTPFFAALDTCQRLHLVETREFPGGAVMTRYRPER